MASRPMLDAAADTGLPEFELVPPPLFEPDIEDPRVHAGARAGLRADDSTRATHGDTSMAHTIADRTLDLVAGLCTRLARAHAAEDVSAVLQDATVAVDAVGVILWMRDGASDALRPVLSHGYSDDLLAQVPSLPTDSDNAIGGAFRSGEARLVAGTDHATGAIAVPVLTPAGCTGVLAAEFRDGGERRRHMRSMLTILAAQLSMVVAHPGALDDQV